MIRSQILLPDSLHKKVKQLSKQKECSFSEIIRKGAEYITDIYAVDRMEVSKTLPPAIDLGGPPRVPVTRWRELANERE